MYEHMYILFLLLLTPCAALICLSHFLHKVHQNYMKTIKLKMKKSLFVRRFSFLEYNFFEFNFKRKRGDFFHLSLFLVIVGDGKNTILNLKPRLWLMIVISWWMRWLQLHVHIYKYKSFVIPAPLIYTVCPIILARPASYYSCKHLTSNKQGFLTPCIISLGKTN